MDGRREIIVRAPNWLGDCVMALPALHALKAATDPARLHVACRDHLRPCLEADPAFASLLPCPPPGSTVALVRSGLRARGLRPDTGLLLTNSFSSAFWLRCTGARERIGYARDGRSCLLTRAVPAPPSLRRAHMTDYYLHLTATLGADPGPGVPPPGAACEPVRPRLTLPTSAVDMAGAVLRAVDATGPYAVLAPASAYGPVKDWPPARYARLANRLATESGLRVLVSGTPAQRAVCEQIAGEAGAVSLAGATDLAGFLGLLAGAGLFVGGDSGGAHAAAALGIPTVVIFGLTEPSRTRPLGARVRLVGRGGESLPDLDDPGLLRRAQAALAAVSVEEVLAAALDAMAG